VPGRVADLPDALIGSTPFPHRQVSHLPEKLGVVHGQLASGAAKQVPGLEQLTQRVELELARGRVPDPNRSGVAVAA